MFQVSSSVAWIMASLFVLYLYVFCSGPQQTRLFSWYTAARKILAGKAPDHLDRSVFTWKSLHIVYFLEIDVGDSPVWILAWNPLALNSGTFGVLATPGDVACRALWIQAGVKRDIKRGLQQDVKLRPRSAGFGLARSGYFKHRLDSRCIPL